MHPKLITIKLLLSLKLPSLWTYFIWITQRLVLKKSNKNDTESHDFTVCSQNWFWSIWNYHIENLHIIWRTEFTMAGEFVRLREKRESEKIYERDAVCKRKNGKIVSYQNKHLLQLLPLLRIIHIKDKKVVTYWNHVSNFHFWICDNNFFWK